MITRTLGPFHFEDLEPHRFEDLVRNLLYDFRDWRSLEPTGRSGADDGYDARGWERVRSDEIEFEAEIEDGGGPAGTVLPPEERCWMIQCKREKSLGPSEVRKIVEGTVDLANAPHGYLLAAPVNFSKKAYDVFRSELSARGVAEFYLWGRSEIEDMLLLPKNDRILFAFMGVSLATRRRSRSTEVRSTVATKNKLARVLNEGSFTSPVNRSVLLRDINDERYPYPEEPPVSSGLRSWQEHVVVDLYPDGLLLEARKHLAYIDAAGGKYDALRQVDMVTRQSTTNEDRTAAWPMERKARDLHERLPKRHRATYIRYGFISYKDVLLVDDKGDGLFDFPHLYVDMSRGVCEYGRPGPFTHSFSYIETEGGSSIRLDSEGPKHAKYFPDELPDPPDRRIVRDWQVALRSDCQWELKRGGVIAFDVGGAFGELEAGDVVEVAGFKGGKDDRLWGEVIEAVEMPAKRCVSVFGLSSIEQLSQLVDRKLRPRDLVRVVELRRSYEYYRLEQNAEF